MFVWLVWAVAAVRAGGLVLRNSTQNKVQEQERASLENAAENKRLHGCLENKRIVLIGPSTSKADYLSLAYFAEYGHWPSGDVVPLKGGGWGPNPLNEAGIPAAVLPVAVTSPTGAVGCTPGGAAETTFRYSNSMFNGKEACDCYEFGPWVGPQDVNNSTENRIYVNGNTMISYFQWFGDVVPPRGTFDLSPLLKVPASPPVQKCPIGQFPGTWAWSMQVKDFLLNVVRHSKPTHLVLSASFWPIQPALTQFWNEIADAGVLAVSDTKGQVLWRTTPQRPDFPANSYSSPRVDMTPFVTKGWKMFPAQQVVSHYQGLQDSNAFFYDFAHLKPASQCLLSQYFLSTYVCPA